MKEKILLWLVIAFGVAFFVWYVRREKARAFVFPSTGDYDGFVIDSAVRWDVPAVWVFAVIRTESKGNPNAVNHSDPSGAWGLMQVLYITATALGYSGQPEGLLDPETNINYGTQTLGQLRKQYGDDFQRVYSAYNSGNPDGYLKYATVAANTRRAVANLEQVLKEGTNV
jgi:soluble lytic murein transglycosylase-like protein